MPAGWTRVSEGLICRFWSNGEAGVTLVVFLALSLQGRWISTTFGFALICVTVRLVKFSPIFSGLFLKGLALSGVSYLAGI